MIRAACYLFLIAVAIVLASDAIQPPVDLSNIDAPARQDTSGKPRIVHPSILTASQGVELAREGR